MDIPQKHILQFTSKRWVYPKVWRPREVKILISVRPMAFVLMRSDANNITLLCTSRGHNSFKRFSLDGKYLSTLFLPGAFVCRASVHYPNIYAGVCWSRPRYLEQTNNSGFVTILDGKDKAISTRRHSTCVQERWTAANGSGCSRFSTIAMMYAWIMTKIFIGMPMECQQDISGY